MAFSAVIFLGLVAISAAVVIPIKTHEPSSMPSDNEWDYILFVQRWPPSACVNGHVTSSSSAKCSFPLDMEKNSWLMHGIWPTKTGTEGPVNCNKSATWSVDPVKPLVTELEAVWTNLESDTTYDSFWSHEWLKHGTCAQNLPALVGEYNFFNVPLTLRDTKYDFYSALSQANITPDADKKFSHAEFTAALSGAYGKDAEVWCAYDKGTKLHYVAEIRLCLDKTFALIDCPAGKPAMRNASLGTDSCPKGEDLVYAPLKPSLPPRPTRPAPMRR